MDFAYEIIKWYSTNKRELPWRNTSDPYLIWLSEIILQQTRVQQGLPYYERFTNRFPTVCHLAEASEQEVLHLWQGLGYYSRARNLHYTAKLVVQHYGGQFPSDYEVLVKLKGIGPYTAAAIASFSKNAPYAVLDGNVFRVLARYFGIDQPINSTEGLKLFKELAQELLLLNNAGEYNQAIMEFGALQCKPQSPDCSICPLQSSCLAFAQQKTSTYPIKLKKIKVKNRYLNYFICIDNDKVLMRKRVESDIWQHMYDFICIENVTNENDVGVLKQQFMLKYQIINEIEVSFLSKNILHKLTHQNIFLNFLVVSNTKYNFINTIDIKWVKVSQLNELPTPKPITNILGEIYKLLNYVRN